MALIRAVQNAGLSKGANTDYAAAQTPGRGLA